MLRVGVMLESLQTSAWVAYILEELQRSPFARVELVVLNTPAPPQQKSFSKKLQAYWKLALYSRYEQWDYQRHRTEPDYRAERNAAHVLEGVPQLKVEPIRKGFSDFFKDEDVAAIRDANLDVMLRFGFRIIRGPVLDTTRYGVWSFHHDDNLEYRGGPPLFWEIYEDNPVSGTVLQILTSALDGGKVIYRSHSATHRRSLYRNRNPIYWKTAEFMLRRLCDLDTRGWGYIQSLPTYSESTPITPKIYRTPHAGQMLGFLAGQFSRAVRDSIRSRTRGAYTQWFLAMRRRSDDLPFATATGYRVLPVPADRFYADPMLVERDGRTWLFFEDYRYDEKRALISCYELAADGTPGEPFEVLRRPYHLSYPFVFEHAGQMYMIPETRENSAVELYRAEDFPRVWTFEKALLKNVSAVDATIHHDGQRFWMFVGLSSGRYSTCDELALFFADDLHGPWQPHLNSPVVSDVRRARPAGALFREGGKLIRPSQDCAKAYGYALNFSEIVTLSPTDYEERAVGRITPDWRPGNLGTHTYTRSADFEVIDGNLPKKLP